MENEHNNTYPQNPFYVHHNQTQMKNLNRKKKLDLLAQKLQVLTPATGKGAR